MNTAEAVGKMIEVIRRKHLALNTERSYCAWLKRYCDDIKRMPSHLSSGQKLEQFLTVLSQNHVTASTQNQAFNAILFFYKEVMHCELTNIQALRERSPKQIRRAPSHEETLGLLKAVQADSGFTNNLVVRLLYGCGLRLNEPLELRMKDVDLKTGKLTIRAAKGGKDRLVSAPCSVLTDLSEQVESARALWRRDQCSKLPVALPHRLAAKYPQAQFEWNWAWLFPANSPCIDPRSGTLVRWRLHQAQIQRSVRKACQKTGIFIMPHELRHAYASHCLNRGANPRAIQEVMGHQSLETTMAYLHADVSSIRSPLD